MSLPKTFPADQLSAANRRKLEWFYRRYVEVYYQEYQFGHFLLAAYAAVPALLTADLLYKLWQNFHQYQWAGKSVRIHRIAVSDLLLSPLCREVGFEMYEMEPSVRRAFLEWQQQLSVEPLWQDRQLASIRSIADFLQEYHARPNPARQRWGSAYEEIQEWNTLAFTEPGALQQKMWQKLQQAVSRNEETETLRILDFWSRSETQLAIQLPDDEQEQWRQNAQFAQAWKALLQHNTQLFTQAIADDPAYRAMLDDNPEGGIAVRMPAEVKQEVDRMQEAAQADTTPGERIFALLVGVNEYAYPELPQLRGCLNDLDDFQQTLESASEYLGMPLEVSTLTDREATIDAVESNLRTLMDQLQNGDHFVFFFAGNSANALARNAWEKDSTLYLQDSEPIKSGWSGLNQRTVEDMIVNLIQKTRVNCLLVLDHPKPFRLSPAEEGYEYTFREQPLYFEGSLVILYGAQSGQSVYERSLGSRQRGIFPYTLLEVTQDKGLNITLKNWIETTRLRMTQLTDQQTPEMEAFPEEMAQALLFSHEARTEEKVYDIRFEPEMSSYVLNAGARQGITPSLEFMPTLVRLEDGRELTIGEVYRDYATLSNFTGDSDISQVYKASLIQTALPKIPIAFDPGIDEKMEGQLRSIIQSYNIYYIDIRDRIEEAKYFIHSWQNEYFLSRQISSRDANSGSIRPIFNLEPDPFELIKQMEYIAQWSGVLEFQNPNSRLNDRDLHVEIGVVEGRVLTIRNLNNVEPSEVLVDPSIVEVAYQSDTDGNRMLQPGIQIRIRSEIRELIYISVLYLDSNYGIEPSFRSEAMEPGADIPLPFTYQGDTYMTVPLNFEIKNLDFGKTEIFDYLKIFVSTAPINVEPLQQESLKLDRQVERTIIMRQKGDQGTFVIGEMDWTTLTIPIKIQYRQPPPSNDIPVQEQQPYNQTKGMPFENFQRQDYSGSEPLNEPGNPEEIRIARDMVAKGELNRAIEQLQNFARGTALENDVTLLSARLNSLESENASGVIAYDEYNRSRNRIQYSVMEMIRLLDSDDPGYA